MTKHTILYVLALYGVYSIYTDLKSSGHLDRIVEWVQPKSNDEEFQLATDIAYYVLCSKGEAHQIANSDQFIVSKDNKKEIVRAPQYISHCLATYKEIWKACDLDNTPYSVTNMSACIADLNEKCK
jgi:hypothetical protein